MIAATRGQGQCVRNRILDHQKSWIKGWKLPVSQQGKSPMLYRLINDEGTRLVLCEYLAGAGERVTGQHLAFAISTYWQSGTFPFEEQPELKDPPKPSTAETQAELAQLAEQRSQIQVNLSSRTAAKWLHEMGYKYKDMRKGVYKDSHEPEDVIQYRQEVFLPTLRALENRIVCWELVDTPNGETLKTIYPANLSAGVRPIVPIVHDETTFNANDGCNKVWIKEDHTLLKNKSRGKGIMVSDFLFPGGRLQVPSSTIIPSLRQYEASDNCLHRLDTQFATWSIKYGGEKWWDGDQLVEQVLKIAIPIFETAFPGCEALFLFDNATSHSGY